MFRIPHAYVYVTSLHKSNIKIEINRKLCPNIFFEYSHGLFKKNTELTELPKLKRNKVLNTQDGNNIMKIILTLPRMSLPRFHQTAW